MAVQQKYKTVIWSLVLSLTAVFLSIMSISIARAETASDFASDVEKGLRAGTQSSVVASIITQDYKTSWDEFGTNVLVDGATTPAEIQKSLVDDIVASLQTELTYNQKDEQYLQSRHSSPEEVMAAEGDGSGDLLPENYIDPHPSLDANPEVNASALDMPTAAVDTTDVVSPSDVGTTPDTAEPTLPDNLAPPGGEWNPSELKVFETILNSDNPPADVPSESPPDTPPPADAPTN